jgi:uncharacterized protein YyaL (SSP411 family)
MIRRLLPLVLLSVALHAQSRYVADGAAGPIRWEGWGTHALERAAKENRPIFVALGYASSFEGFRLQHEAFANADVAETLNDYYVPVLLDRLEYPEIAESYETIARSMNGPGGAPILMILTPALEPFALSGTLSAADLSRMLVLNANRWAHERDAAVAEARQNVEKARAFGERRGPAAIEANTLANVRDAIAKNKSNAPQPMAMSFLVHTKNTTAASDMLHKLALTAVYDQLGGGFHRAARDEAWKQPYFEKMLADQALLAIAYLEAWQTTRDPEFERVARATLDAAIRDLHPKNIAFEASQDAHSLVPAKGPEFWNGAFYIWETDEVTRLLGRENAAKVFRAYGMKDGVRNVLSVEDAEALKDPAIAPLLAKMLELRQKRPQPFREWNLIAGPNALMISALARGGAVFGEKTYVDTATVAAQVVIKNLWNAPKKTLLHSAGVAANADDYAMLVQGMLDLFNATYDPRWLDLAIAMQQRQDQLFWDPSLGRYATGSSVPQALRGLLNERDEETPAVSSVAAMNLLRLALLTGNETWRARPAMMFESFGIRLRDDGAHLAQLATAYATSLETGTIAVVTGDPRRKPTVDALHAVQEQWSPLRFVLFVPPPGPAHDRIVKAFPFTAPLQLDPKNPITYECRGGECARRGN